MVKVSGRKPSDNVVDARVNRSSTYWWLAGAGGGCVAAGAVAWGMGLVDDVLCQFELGQCVSEERIIELDRFAAVILGDTERVWTAEFAEQGQTYRPATLVLHDEQQTSLCGVIQAGQGPAYCKFDERIYLDLTYFSERVPEEGAEGDFPPAFIIAHEVAHHVQNITGIFDENFLGRLDDPEVDANRLMVRLELQADCLAGVWAKRADDRFDIIEDGDFEEAVKTAQIFGDDAQQAKDASGAISEASFTHGTGEQRARWLKIGFEAGERAACDTWAPEYDAL